MKTLLCSLFAFALLGGPLLADAQGLTYLLSKGFRCGDPITDVDGNVYRTVEIGDQCWMAENLAVEHYRNGDAILTGRDLTGGDRWNWQATTSGAFAVYDDDPATKGIYGLLYNWYAVADPRSICPDGWHVPTDGEWTELTDHLGGTGVAGGKMKTTGTLGAGTGLWTGPNTGATNTSGFSGLPGGAYCYKYCYTKGDEGNWWSATESSTNSAWFRLLGYDNADVYRNDANKGYGFSVRCVRDE
jgi:uncharacterized protein (TIGR02145 family)